MTQQQIEAKVSLDTLKLALEALESCDEGDWSTGHVIHPSYDQKAVTKAITALCEAIAAAEQHKQAQKDHTYGYAKQLAEAIFKLHFASDEHYASGRIVWGVNDTVIGILTQIDNMVADMVRKPEQAQTEANERSEVEPVAECVDDGEGGIYYRTITKHVGLLYTSPPSQSSQRPMECKPLTDEQMRFLATAIDQAQKQEPVAVKRLRRGDILRCIETDELCTVWSTSTTGKALVKWSANNFGEYTAEQIGDLFWLELEPDDLELAAEKSDNYAAFHAGYRFAVAHKNTGENQ